MITINKQIQRGLSYIISNIKNFNVDFNMDADEGVKPFIELVFLFNIINKNKSVERKYVKIEKYIDKEIEKTPFSKELKENVLGIAGLSILEEYLQSKNMSKYKKVLQEIVEENNIDELIERTPFRELDMKYSLNKAGIQDNLPSYDDIFKNTVLGTNLPLIYYSTTSAYSVTHTIFYITDMGENYNISSEISNIEYLLTYLIGMYINNDDLDVLAEVLLCVLFLDLYESINTKGLFDFAITYILKKQKRDGSFPAPNCSNSNSKKQRFKEDYHTTLVCIGVLKCLFDKKRVFNKQ